MSDSIIARFARVCSIVALMTSLSAGLRPAEASPDMAFAYRASASSTAQARPAALARSIFISGAEEFRRAGAILQERHRMHGPAVTEYWTEVVAILNGPEAKRLDSLPGGALQEDEATALLISVARMSYALSAARARMLNSIEDLSTWSVIAEAVGATEIPERFLGEPVDVVLADPVSDDRIQTWLDLNG